MKFSTFKALFTFCLLFIINHLSAQDIELTVRFDAPNCTYQVYATPDFTQNNFIVAGGSQITVLLPSDMQDTPLTVTSVAGGPWSDNSQVYGPGASPENDFHAISSNGSSVNFVSGEEVLLFTFVLPGGTCCTEGIRLFNNGSDPESNETGMGGGDFNNYFANALLLDDYYSANYDNTGTICDECLINPVDAPTATATTQDFCVIDTPTLADIQVNEENIRWYATADSDIVLPETTALTDGNTYYAAQFDPVTNCESETRLAITVNINDAATPTTDDATQDFCLIDSPTVADIQVNETGVIWYDAATGGNVVDGTTALVDGATYYASLTDAVNGCESSVRLAVTISVDDAPTPTTTDATQDFCLIDSPTVADIQVNEAGVIWYDAATGGNVVANTTSLVDGSIYYASLTDAVTGCESSVRLAVTISVDDAPTPTTNDTTQDFCLVDSPTVADIQVNETGVIWYTAATGGSVVTNDTALADDTVYYASLTVGDCESATRLAVTVNVNDVATPTTDDATQEFCLADTPTVADIQVNETGVIWYDTATGGNVVAGTASLVDGTTYYASLTDAVNGCESSVRLAVTISVDDAPTPTTNDTTQDFCLVDSPTVADIQVNETGVVWYDAATGGNVVANTASLVNGTTYYGSLTVGDCESATRLAVTVTVGNAPTPTTNDTTQDFCLIDSPTVADIQVNETGVIWYDAATGGNIVAGTVALSDGIYYASLTIGSCDSATRLAVTVQVNDAATPSTNNTTQEFCAYNTPTIADIQVNEAGVIWYASATGGSALAATTALVNNTNYYAALVENGCESSVRLAVTVNLSDLCDVAINAKVMLQGSLYNAVGGLMRDNLRTMGLIPLSQPYSSALNIRFTHVNGGGAETTTTGVLQANAGTGNAIVDWVFVEIRSADNPQTVLRTVSALLQRDGDIVAADGGELIVQGLPENFYVAVKHRNHLGAMGAQPLTVQNGEVTIDFTLLNDNELYTLPGNAAGIPMATVNGVRALYPANASFDRRVKYDGAGNDRQVLGFQVLSHPDNTGQVLNYAGAEGYFSGDINMDGKVLYDGANNDRQLILNIILTYPLNTGGLSNFNDMLEQIP